MNQSFEEQQTGIFCTMQSLIHQIEAISNDKKYKFKFKQETERYYKTIERICEGFTERFNQSKATTDGFVSIVQEIDSLAGSIKIVNETR